MNLPFVSLSFSLGLVLTGFGCKAKVNPPPKGASCAEVAANIVRIGKGLNNQREAIAQCEAEKMPARLRNCLAKAVDLDGLGACRKIVFKRLGLRRPGPRRRPRFDCK